MAGAVRVVDKWVPFLAKRDLQLDTMLELMAADVERLAKQTAPVKTGELVSSIYHVRVDIMHFRVWAGEKGPSMAYARYQEYGVRADGSHVVRNYTKPGTGAGFMRASGKTVAQNIEAYAETAKELL